MERVAFYSRVSTTDEKQLDALDKQIEELRSFINKNPNWVLSGEYIDRGKTGTTKKGRDGYLALFEDISQDKFDTVLIKDESRLARNTFEWYRFLNELNVYNVKLYFYLENKYYENSNALLTGIKAILAEEYSRELSKKSHSAAKRSQIKGTSYSNGMMLGLTQQNGKLIINEKEADIVRYIFDCYVSGDGVKKIMLKLNNLGIKSSNDTPFSISTLKRMLRNERYNGTLISGKTKKNFFTKKTEKTDPKDWIIHKDFLPKIIDDDTWNKAQAILESRRKKTADRTIGYNSNMYPLSGKIYCGKCGSHVWHTNYYTRKDKIKKEQWQCGKYRMFGKNSPNGCNLRPIFNDRLMLIVKEAILSQMDDIDSIMDNILECLSKSIERPTYNTVDKIKFEIEKENHRLEDILDLFLDKTIDKNEYISKRESIKSNISILENKLEKEKEVFKSLDDVKGRINKIKNIMSIAVSSANEIPDEFIKNNVQKVVLYDNKVEVTLFDGDQYISVCSLPDASDHELILTFNNSKNIARKYKVILKYAV